MGIRTFLGLKQARHPAMGPEDGHPSVRLMNPVQPTFPIDIVITWVNGEDPLHKSQRRTHLDPDLPLENYSEHRFKSIDELKYCIRSIEMFAPWVRHIFVVTDNQKPDWLKPGKRLKIIDHKEIIEHKFLPTFNSHVIESCLHRIPNLANHFIYFNDDVLLLKKSQPSDFFTFGGLAINFLGSTDIPSNALHGRDTASAVAANQACNLLEIAFGASVRKRLSHMCFPLRKDQIEKCEENFVNEFETMRLNKFRSATDVLCTGCLYPIFSYLNGHAILCTSNFWYVKIRDEKAKTMFSRILRFKNLEKQRLACCVNDTYMVEEDKEYEVNLINFLEQYFPEKSVFEH